MAYIDREEARWWNKKLKPGFQHVQLWKSVQYGPHVRDVFWLVVDPGMEFIATDAVFESEPPWVKDKSMTVQRVLSVCEEKIVRSWFFIGPVTCVEIAKAYLGINSPWIRTPLQLHNYIAERQGVLLQR